MAKIIWIIVSIFCFFAMYFAGNDSPCFSNRVFITSILIQIISIYNIFSRQNEPYSLEKIFYLFSLFFFGVAPLLQSYENSKFWYISPLLEQEYFYLNILILFIIVFYKIFYDLFRKTIKLPGIRNKLSKYAITNKIPIFKGLLLISISLFSFVIVFASNSFSIIPMLLRGGELVDEVMRNNTSQDGSPTTWLLINNFIRPLSIMCFLYYAISMQRNIIIFIILGLLALITCFPIAIPRFAAAAMYIPVILILISFFRKKNIFSLSFIGGLLFIFPFLNIFRNYDSNKKIELGLDFKMFTEPHFDSYQNFALIFSNDIITYGQQLFGVFLFWVPRSFWINKPLGSGAFTANKLNFFFDNVAINYFAEGYINFGIFGVLLFLIFLAFATAKLDKIYWTNELSLNNNFFRVLYMISLGMLFFILRGDLMSSFAYFLGFLISGLLVLKFVK